MPGNMSVNVRYLVWASAALLFLLCTTFTFTMGKPWARPRHPVHAPDDNANQLQSIVILGAGIIGLTTAYSLLTEWEALVRANPTARARPRPEITIVEPSKRPSPAASSQATGGLGDFGFAPETAPLGALSFQLLARLAEQVDGRKNYQYTKQTVFRVTPENFTGTPAPPDTWGPSPPVEVRLSNLPSWLKTEADWTAQILATAPHGAHLDPAEFCAFIYKRCEELGVKFAFGSTVTSVAVNEASQRFTSVHIKDLGQDGASRTVPCETIVIAAGPWSDRVFSSLFPSAKAKLMFDVSSSAGHHFRVRTPEWKHSDDEKGSEQVFLGSVVSGGHSLDITSFPDGTLYIGGYGAIPEPLPEFADEVKPQWDQIEAMIKLTSQFLGVPLDEKHISDVGRAYRPRAVPNHPIITKVDWSLLGTQGPAADRIVSQIRMISPEKPATDCAGVVGGLFINTGHFSDGVTLSLGSGKVMAELLLGKEPSVDISGLGLP